MLGAQEEPHSVPRLTLFPLLQAPPTNDLAVSALVGPHVQGFFLFLVLRRGL